MNTFKSKRAQDLVAQERRDRRLQLLAVFAAGALFGAIIVLLVQDVRAW